ncbi:MAG: SDR family oxidoreductase [Pseudomonadota bacterium]|nr:SDR family oxidoreductase [Pseudomonadota bacterium]
MAEQKVLERPAQHQAPPGKERAMTPEPVARRRRRPSGKLEGKVAIVTGGDSGIGRAVSVMFAEEGADVVIVYRQSHEDAAETRRMVEGEGRRCVTIAGDLGDPAFSSQIVDRTMAELGRLDILVNNAAEQHVVEDPEDIPTEQMERTFRTNIFSMFYLTKVALPHMRCGAAIINTTSITAWRGSEHLLDYSATKGAIVSFTRSLARMVADRGIRVNGVAPGPIWTPLIPSSFPKEAIPDFGKNTLLGRPGEPAEVAPCYVFLASEDASYMTGQFLHPNGGEIAGT